MFRADAFASASLAMPQKDVAVPDLVAWFDGEDKPVWRVRGLDANDLAKIDATERRGKAEAALAAALRSTDTDQITEGVREFLGRGAAVEPIYARQVEALVLGSVTPKIEHHHAAKLGESYPIVFRTLFNEIMALTGEGAHAEKKPRRSGKTPESAPP